MTAVIRNLLNAARIASGLVGLTSVLDLAVGIPFSRFSIMMDIMFLISSLIVIYMIRQCFQELR